MTDKQIIIDGCDVSGCTYSQMGIDRKCYCEQDLYDDGTPVFTCDECPNCYFKQLARKTQECEELKNRLKYIRDENIHLKESATDEQIDFTALNNHIKALEFQIGQLKAENIQLSERYKQAVEEIKRYCRHNRQAGWVDIEGIFEIIQECEEVNVND